MNTPRFLIDTPPWNIGSSGCRVMHYLAALLHAANFPVAVHALCFYNPTIPVANTADENDIAVYPEAHWGNRFNAKRVCRYVLYYLHIYFHGNKIGKDEACIIYQPDYLKDIEDYCDHPVDNQDIVTLPCLDAMWCFPEAKTGKDIFYEGKKECAEYPFLTNIINIPPITESQEQKNDCHDPAFGHQRSLALLRMAKKFYTLDHHTLLSLEAFLCGCRVFYVRSKENLEEQTDLQQAVALYTMNPARDVTLARKFADRTYKFFNL